MWDMWKLEVRKGEFLLAAHIRNQGNREEQRFEGLYGQI